MCRVKKLLILFFVGFFVEENMLDFISERSTCLLCAMDFIQNFKILSVCAICLKMQCYVCGFLLAAIAAFDAV